MTNEKNDDVKFFYFPVMDILMLTKLDCSSITTFYLGKKQKDESEDFLPERCDATYNMAKKYNFNYCREDIDPKLINFHKNHNGVNAVTA